MNERKVKKTQRTLKIGTSQFVSLKKSRLRWFGRVECKDDNDWVKCMAWEIEGIRQRGSLKKT